MSKEAEVKIARLYEYPVIISGDETEVKLKVVNLKNSAQNYSGYVTHEQEEEKGTILRFAFADMQLMEVWANSINTL